MLCVLYDNRLQQVSDKVVGHARSSKSRCRRVRNCLIPSYLCLVTFNRQSESHFDTNSWHDITRYVPSLRRESVQWIHDAIKMKSVWIRNDNWRLQPGVSYVMVFCLLTCFRYVSGTQLRTDLRVSIVELLPSLVGGISITVGDEQIELDADDLQEALQYSQSISSRVKGKPPSYGILRIHCRSVFSRND